MSVARHAVLLGRCRQDVRASFGACPAAVALARPFARRTTCPRRVRGGCVPHPPRRAGCNKGGCQNGLSFDHVRRDPFGVPARALSPACSRCRRRRQRHRHRAARALPYDPGEAMLGPRVQLEASAAFHERIAARVGRRGPALRTRMRPPVAPSSRDGSSTCPHRPPRARRSARAPRPTVQRARHRRAG